MAVRPGAATGHSAVRQIRHVPGGDALFGQRCTAGDCQGGDPVIPVAGSRGLLASRRAGCCAAFVGLQLLVAEFGADWRAALANAPVFHGRLVRSRFGHSLHWT
ncbi:hypothetical protein D3C78_520920 [compost metagenome]